jgi:hypothetical protein
MRKVCEHGAPVRGEDAAGSGERMACVARLRVSATKVASDALTKHDRRHGGVEPSRSTGNENVAGRAILQCEIWRPAQVRAH